MRILGGHRDSSSQAGAQVSWVQHEKHRDWGGKIAVRLKRAEMPEYAAVWQGIAHGLVDQMRVFLPSVLVVGGTGYLH